MQKTALVTGGNKGIGLEITKTFLALDYDVILLARDFNNFELSTHPRIKTVTFDLVNVDAIPALIASLPAIDVLINNAGIMYAIPYQNYENDTINTMLKRGGRIVNNASIAGQIGHPDIWYGITKAGLINATKSFSKIFEGKIIINAVAPSPVATDMLNTIPPARQEAFLKSVISKRFARPEEIAKTIAWLATESPEYINGTIIDINNGSFPR